MRFPGRLGNRERVVVGLEDDGSAASVVVTQRLLVSLSGDFTFTIPAPATKVVAAPGSDAQPGLRDLGIVWQGFSGGRRELGAIATLSLTEAETGLPLAIAVRPRGSDTAITLTSIARRPVSYSVGSVPLRETMRALLALRDLQRKAGQGGIAGILDVDGTPRGQVTTTASAPFTVRGTIRVAGRAATNVDVLLGNGHPTETTVTLPGRVSPRLELSVDLLPALEILPRPRDLAAARNPLMTLQESLARLALSWQFRRYLASPDQLGPSTTTYVYRTLAPRQVIAAARPGKGSSDDTLAIVLVAMIGGAALLGLAVLWARS